MRYWVDDTVDELSGPAPSWGRPWRVLEWKIGKRVLKEFFGDYKFVDFSEKKKEYKYIFLRCEGCKKLRTLKRRKKKMACRCGSRQMGPIPGDVTPRHIISALIFGR